MCGSCTCWAWSPGCSGRPSSASKFSPSCLLPGSSHPRGSWPKVKNGSRHLQALAPFASVFLRFCLFPASRLRVASHVRASCPRSASRNGRSPLLVNSSSILRQCWNGTALDWCLFFPDYFLPWQWAGSLGICWWSVNFLCWEWVWRCWDWHSVWLCFPWGWRWVTEKILSWTWTISSSSPSWGYWFRWYGPLSSSRWRLSCWRSPLSCCWLSNPCFRATSFEGCLCSSGLRFRWAVWSISLCSRQSLP